MKTVDLGVIGAGLAGLTVARGAAEAGLSVQLLDKGRGLGGRLATRRTEAGFRFDHGAQYLRPGGDGFRAFLKDAEAAGAVADWGPADGGVVGQPGMTGLPKYLAKGLEIETGRRAGRIRRDGRSWEVIDTEGVPALRADRLVMAMPAPQITMVLGPDHPGSAAIAEVRFAPCWTLMVGFGQPPALPEIYRDTDPEAVLAWLARDGGKPGRGDAAAYVAQAGAAWSRRHLEREPDWVRARLIEALAEQAARPLPAPDYTSVHRWRFSTADRPLGASHVALPEGLFLCGDWCLGNRAEHAWKSAQAVLRALSVNAEAQPVGEA